MSNAIPVIDISPLLTGGAEGLSKVAAEVGEACRGTGFFCIKGHGLEPGLKEEVFRQSAQFFALPDAVKRQTLFSATTGNRGYVPMKGEALDPTRPADLKEAFNIGLELAADDPDIAAGARFRALNLWPELPEFRPVMLSYFNAVWSIGRQLHRAFAHERQRHVRQRGQIARGTHRTLDWNVRHDAGVEHRQQGVDDHRPHA